MLQKNFSLFYFTKSFSKNSRSAEDDDRKTWFNLKKFIYDSITWPDREIALTTQLKYVIVMMKTQIYNVYMWTLE